MSVISTGLYSKLSGGTALTSLLSGGTAHPENSIFKDSAPDNPTFDYVVFSNQGGGDLNITPSRMKDLLVYVRAYTKTSAARALLIDNAFDALLHNSTITVTGWTNYHIGRELDLDGDEIAPDGSKIYNSGGVYRISIDS